MDYNRNWGCRMLQPILSTGFSTTMNLETRFEEHKRIATFIMNLKAGLELGGDPG